MDIAIIGGGAAGFFSAITCAAAMPRSRVTIFERGKSVLEKVRISGGGRCNVTHACFDAKTLVQYYPRGSRELLGPFMQFGPQQTIEWFQKRGVALKTEADGRMFPTTDNSQTIVDCLQKAAQQAGVVVRTHTRVEKIFLAADKKNFQLQVQGEAKPLSFSKVLVATGSNTAIWEMLQSLGHTIVPPVPSLFTFNIKDPRILDLMGIAAAHAQVRVPGTKLHSEGPLLITHWGMSGPGILRLSAWGARTLEAQAYQFPLEVNWLGRLDAEAISDQLQLQKMEHAKKLIFARPLFELPARLWERLVTAAEIPDTLRWADLDKKRLQKLITQLSAGNFSVKGKSTFKEEFVTAGGVALNEVNFKTFESKKVPGLYLAGEVLDIDAITGGFNFQAAWTGAWIAGNAMAQALTQE
jgi:predicted Rossmann fold flavoprotein